MPEVNLEPTTNIKYVEVEYGFEGKSPSHYYVVNATGGRTYFMTRERTKAIAACNALYGDGKYVVRVDGKIEKPKGNPTVRANQYRKGQKKYDGLI